MSSYRKEIRRIMHALSVMDNAYCRWAKIQGIKDNTLNVIYALNDGEYHSQKQLCAETMLPKTTINTIVKECEADGYVVLQLPDGHGREKQICLTEKGRQFADRVLKCVYEMEDKAMENTLAKYSDEFIDVLEYFCDNLSGAFDKNGERAGKKAGVEK